MGRERERVTILSQDATRENRLLQLTWQSSHSNMLGSESDEFINFVCNDDDLRVVIQYLLDGH